MKLNSASKKARVILHNLNFSSQFSIQIRNLTPKEDITVGVRVAVQTSN